MYSSAITTDQRHIKSYWNEWSNPLGLTSKAAGFRVKIRTTVKDSELPKSSATSETLSPHLRQRRGDDLKRNSNQSDVKHTPATTRSKSSLGENAMPSFADVKWARLNICFPGTPWIGRFTPPLGALKHPPALDHVWGPLSPYYTSEQQTALSPHPT